MDTLSNIINLLLWLLVGVPVCFLLHELGHVSMVLLPTNQKVTFQFGVHGPTREFHFGRLTIHMYLEPTTFIGARYHLENREGLSRSQILWMTIGGED